MKAWLRVAVLVGILSGTFVAAFADGDAGGDVIILRQPLTEEAQ
jgi:hypothetical protein